MQPRGPGTKIREARVNKFMCEHLARTFIDSFALGERDANLAAIELASAPFRCACGCSIRRPRLDHRCDAFIHTAAELSGDAGELLFEQCDHAVRDVRIYNAAFVAQQKAIAIELLTAFIPRAFTFELLNQTLHRQVLTTTL